MTDKVEFTGDDIAAALAWLKAKIKRGSDRDLQARRTLARMLRSDPTDTGLLWVLADALDPDRKGGRQLILKRKAGRPPKANPLDIAVFVYKHIEAQIAEQKSAGKPQKAEIEAAIQAAVADFGVDRSTVFRAWKQFLAR